MFESHLAPAGGEMVQRDLSSAEVWEVSLQRSRRRRELAAAQRRTAPKTNAATAAVSAALLVSPMLAAGPASAGTSGGGARAASVLPPAIEGVVAARGDVGRTVAAVQRTVGVAADGIFGPVTQRAVKDFQARVGLKPTGKVDARTFQALSLAGMTTAPRRTRSDSSTPTPRRGRATPAPTPRRGRATPTPTPRRGRATPVPAPDTTAQDPATAATPAGACGVPLSTPVAGPVTSGFGDGRHHAGVDIIAPSGTPVGAAACGTVTRAGTQSGYGRIVCIAHNPALSTCYAHLSQITVAEGAYVAAGQVIGNVGRSGRASGPHLHFETRVNGHAQDPAPYLGRAQTQPAAPATK